MHVAMWALVSVWLSSGHTESMLVRWYVEKAECQKAAEMLTSPIQPMLCLDSHYIDSAVR